MRGRQRRRDRCRPRPRSPRWRAARVPAAPGNVQHSAAVRAARAVQRCELTRSSSTSRSRSPRCRPGAVRRAQRPVIRRHRRRVEPPSARGWGVLLDPLRRSRTWPRDGAPSSTGRSDAAPRRRSDRPAAPAVRVDRMGPAARKCSGSRDGYTFALVLVMGDVPRAAGLAGEPRRAFKRSKTPDPGARKSE